MLLSNYYDKDVSDDIPVRIDISYNNVYLMWENHLFNYDTKNGTKANAD